MKVEKSKYLAQVKPLLKQLLQELLKSYPYASILAADATSKRYSVDKMSMVIGEDRMLSNRGFVIKAYDGSAYGEYSFNEISEEKIPEIVEALKANVFEMAETLTDGISRSEYKMLADEPVVFAESTEYEVDPMSMGDDEILKELREVKDAGLAYSDKILNCSSSFVCQKYSKLFLSPNRDMEQNVMLTNGYVAIDAKRGEEVKNYFKGFSMLGGAELLKEIKTEVGNVAQAAIELLDAVPMIPGEYECICTPGVTGMIVHEAFGHGVEMDMFVKDRALAQSFVGKEVASSLVTMHDGASAASESATYFFDDEGVLATDTVVIKNGVLQTGISDLQSAMALGTTPTGNGRRQDTGRKAYTRMTNTFFEAGQDKLEDMIASIKDGVLLENATSGMEDPKNWGIQMMVNIAREIKDGKLTGKIYSPCVLSGYVPDLLKSITMMSDTVQLSGTGFCGKGYKEWVKVSDGGPYIKARIRLG